MTERFVTGFHPFVIPFLAGMAFVLAVCAIKTVIVVRQLDKPDRKKWLLSLIHPNIIVKNGVDIIVDCLLHVRLWKRNRVLGFMHSSIAFGWFMIILLGHLQVLMYFPERLSTFYYPIFFDYFIEGGQHTVISRLLDAFLLLVLAGISLAIVKRFWSRLFGMRRTTRPTLFNLVGLYSLWAIFPLRLLAEQCAGRRPFRCPLVGVFNCSVHLYGGAAFQPISAYSCRDAACNLQECRCSDYPVA